MARNKIKVPAYLVIGKVVFYVMYAWIVFGIITLGLRVFLLAFSANAGTPFVKFIYTTSANFLEPFRGIFPPKPVGETGYLDVAALFAMIMYGLIGWGFAALTHYIQTKIDDSKAAAKEVERQEEAAAYRASVAKQSAAKQAPAKSRPPARSI